MQKLRVAKECTKWLNVFYTTDGQSHAQTHIASKCMTNIKSDLKTEFLLLLGLYLLGL